MILTQRYSLPVALLVGAALGFAGLPGRHESDSVVSIPSGGADGLSAGSAHLGAASEKSTISSEPSASASECAAAWETLKDGHLPERERAALQSLILQQWSRADLPAAIQAAAVDQGTGSWSDLDMQLRGSLRPGLAAHPERAWHLIQTHAAGFDTTWLREEWIQAVRIRNPDMVIKVASQFPMMRRGMAISAAIAGSRQLAEGGVGDEAVVDAFLALPEGQLTRSEISWQLGNTIPRQEILERVLHAHSPGGRRVYLEAYVDSQRPLMHLGLGLELESLPPEFHEEVEQIIEAKKQMERTRLSGTTFPSGS